MSAIDVARKDFLDVRRAKIVWFVAGLYVAFMALLLYFGQRDVAEPDIRSALWNLTGVGALFVPLIALVSAYLSIAGERESGSIKYLLSIPNSRRDVVLGKYLTRSAVVAGAIAISFLAGIPLGLAWYPSLETASFVRLAALTVLYAVTYVAVAVGISAATASRSRAMGAAIGFFFVTNVLTMFRQFSIIGALDWLLNDVLGRSVSGDALEFLRAAISPTNAYVYSTSMAFPDGYRDVPKEAPWYLEGDVMVVLLFAWLVVPIALGLWQFERADIG